MVFFILLFLENLNTTDSTSRLLLWEYGTNNAKRYRFPHGTEGLYYSTYYHDIWGLMEHPGQRAVFGVPLSTYSF